LPEFVASFNLQIQAMIQMGMFDVRGLTFDVKPAKPKPEGWSSSPNPEAR
jgi:hypothetical protein